MAEEIVSARGVYRDLEKSPYGYKTPYGDVFKFRSKKKLEMFTREIKREIDRVDKFMLRNGLEDFLRDDYYLAIFIATYHALYRKIEG